jgi:hypothetical protein
MTNNERYESRGRRPPASSYANSSTDYWESFLRGVVHAKDYIYFHNMSVPLPIGLRRVM